MIQLLLLMDSILIVTLRRGHVQIGLKSGTITKIFCSAL